MSRPPASTRLAWPDVAKGMSILGVVLLHVCLAVPKAETSTLALLNTLADPLRMPLFFLISGLFATKIFHFSFSRLVTGRLWFFFVPYLIWVPAELYLKSREYFLVHDTPMPPLREYLEALVLGSNMAWFLYALMVFNVILWLTRNMPAPAAVTVSFFPILALPLHAEFHMWGKAVLYLPIFFLGAYARTGIITFAERALTPIYLGATMLIYLVGLALFLGWQHIAKTSELAVFWPLPGAGMVGAAEIELLVRLATHVLMLPAGLTIAVLLSNIAVISQTLQTIGRNTLPVYLGHPLALTLLYHFTQYRLQLPIMPDSGHWITSTGFWMLAATSICFLGGAALWALSRVPVVGWVVTPPPIHGLLRADRAPKIRGTAQARTSNATPANT